MRPFIGALMLVLWLAPSAWAIPSQYILNSDASGGHTDYPGDVWSGPGHGNVGTVTFDSSLTIPFVSWDIEIRNRFSNLIDEVGMNGAVVGVPTEFRLATH